MAFIILEGNEKVGKSAVAAHFEKQGFKVIHMSAPDKKYFKPGYTGPSYLDEMLEIVMDHDGQDVVFDRSWYGEACIWPEVFNRASQLSEEDLEVLKDFESKNSTQRILLVDPDQNRHWDRCVEYGEPITRRQFVAANSLYQKMAHNHNFMPMQLEDFLDEADKAKIKGETDSIPPQEEQDTERRPDNTVDDDKAVVPDTPSKAEIAAKTRQGQTEEQRQLEKANAINKILNSKIVKQKGSVYDEIEEEVRVFLNSKLSALMGKEQPDQLSRDEIFVLKTFCKQWMQKMENK